jgi:hypothetical protein
MDMAVGVIIGSAFSGIVTALTTDIINPLINGIGGAELGGSLKIYGGQEILYGRRGIRRYFGCYALFPYSARILARQALKAPRVRL